MASKLRVLGGLQDKSRGSLFIVWVASGIEMAWTWSRLLYGTWEPVVSMLREKFKWRSHENESTDAKHRGGSSCISVEGSVMGLERRGWVSSRKEMVNQATGRNRISFCVGFKPWGFKRKADRSRVNREVHARICGSLGVKFPWATRLCNFSILVKPQYMGFSKSSKNYHYLSKTFCLTHINFRTPSKKS
jgi:hypothetical protein